MQTQEEEEEEKNEGKKKAVTVRHERLSFGTDFNKEIIFDVYISCMSFSYSGGLGEGRAGNFNLCFVNAFSRCPPRRS